MAIDYVDIIVGVAWGDEGKGKISSRIASEYDYVCRFNGGNNAGHTFYIDGKKIITHIVPSGIAFGKNCVIGPNCVVSVEDYFAERRQLEELGYDISLIKISPKAHIVTNEHKKLDQGANSKMIGTTAMGIGPCYADKASRIGVRAETVLPEEMLWDENLSGAVLCEGAQSFWLDINQGNYPYVTSSECLPYAACSLGFSPKQIRNIIAVGKMYDTRSGTDQYFDMDDEETRLVAKLGNEFGATTGRARQVKWLNLNKLRHAITVSGATELIMNKGDILEQAGVFKLFSDNVMVTLNDMDHMKRYISDNIDIEVKFDFNI